MAKDQYKYFRVEARDLTDQLGRSVLELERDGSGGEVVPRLLRLAHTLKGAARVVRQPEIANHAHDIEDLLTPFREHAGAVPHDSIQSLLQLLDGIAERLAKLTTPDAPTAGAESSAPTEAVRVTLSDTQGIDDLLGGVSQASAQLRGLRDLSRQATHVSRLTEQLAESSALDSRALGSVELLRTLTASIERGIAGSQERIDRELRQVRDAANQLRLVAAGALFANFERTTRDSAHALGKDVTFSGAGGDIRLDANVAQIAHDAIVQMIRNAVAHGIESRHDRLALGKTPFGQVNITVLRRGRRIVFCCEDDGHGIDIAALREAALRKGRAAAELDRLEADALVHALLASGISTSTTLSEVAGRGIGMDIVREAVRTLGAELGITTSAGQGTRFELAVPVSISSVDAILLEAGGVPATLPLHAVRQTLRLAPPDIHRTTLGDTIIYDGAAIPLLSLRRLLGRVAQPPRTGSLSAVIVATSQGSIAISVDRLLGTSVLVYRPLPELASATPAIGGASLDTDGNPVLMLNPDGLAALGMHPGETADDAEAARPPVLIIDDSLTTRMLEQSILESAGYEVDVAISGEDGLEQARRRNYALILCDVEMPGLDGFGFIEAIRRDVKLRDVPAILVTSRNAPEDRRRGREIGAQDYIVKSEFDQAELLDRIRQLVR